MGEVVTLVTGGSHPAIPVISDARRSGLKRNFRSSQRIFNLLRSTLDVGSSPRTTRKGDTSGSIGRGLIALAVNEPHAPFHSGLAKFADMWLSHAFFDLCFSGISSSHERASWRTLPPRSVEMNDQLKTRHFEIVHRPIPGLSTFLVSVYFSTPLPVGVDLVVLQTDLIGFLGFLGVTQI